MLTRTVCTQEHDIETHQVVELGKFTRPFGLSFAITSILSALLVVVKETNPDTVLAWMKAATGHHWVTHGIVDLLVFVFLGWLLARPNCGDGVHVSTRSLVGWIIAALVVSWVIIIGFFLI